jgi:hypothetical protein
MSLAANATWWKPMGPSFAHTVVRTSGNDRSGPILGPVLAAAGITAALVALLPGDPDRSDPVPADPDGFVAAYERSRTAELLVGSTFTRTFNDGRELAYETTLIQRPPDDVLVVGAGSASGRLGGRLTRCNAPAADSPPDCIRSDEAAPPYAEQVDEEVDVLRTLLDGVYDLELDDAGCWILTLAVVLPDAPYGGAARFCFDDATGALESLEVRKPEAVERTEAVTIATEVTEADLRLPTLGEPIATE